MIKLLVFDVDGTLYKSTKEIIDSVHTYCINQLSKKLHIPLFEAKKLFFKQKAITKSSTKVLVDYGVGTPEEIFNKSEAVYMRVKRKYLSKDDKLLTMLTELSQHYTLGTLRNGILSTTHKTLKLLGITDSTTPFSYYFPTVELGVIKPDPLPFQNILTQTGLKPDEIVMIGDRVEVDLVPAKRLGFHTVYVSWESKMEKKNEKNIDLTIPTIYDMQDKLDIIFVNQTS